LKEAHALYKKRNKVFVELADTPMGSGRIHDVVQDRDHLAEYFLPDHPWLPTYHGALERGESVYIVRFDTAGEGGYLAEHLKRK
jgi:hypothetical protein